VEKRKTSRVPLDIYLNKYVSGVPYMARTSDISHEGISLAHLIEPQIAGKRVGLQFQLPGSEEVIYAEGEIVSRVGRLARRRRGQRRSLHPAPERHRRMIEQYSAPRQRRVAPCR